MNWLQLNCLVTDWTLAEPPELSTVWIDSAWAFYTLTWLWLNCLLGDLTLAELSSRYLTLAELSTGWPDSSWTVFSWTVYWLSWLWLNCLLVDMTVAELPTEWRDSSWTVYWLTWPCLLGDLTVVEPSTWGLKSFVEWFDNSLPVCALTLLLEYFSWMYY